MTSGESHGEAMTATICGIPAGVKISIESINEALQEKDVPNKIIGTKRKDLNEVKILSGLSPDNITYGTPITLVIFNENAKKNHYADIEKQYRPGHAEFAWHSKFGIYPLTGGGRASGRECIVRLALGEICMQVLSQAGEISKNISFSSKITEIAGENNIEEGILKAINLANKYGDSTGGKCKIIISGVPKGLGSPTFGKLSSVLFYAFSTIGGVKGIEQGNGFEASRLTGSQNNDQIGIIDDKIKLLSNNSGGTLGGISTGEDIVFTLGVKPTPSIAVSQKTVNWENNIETNIKTIGRHDINFTPRVAEIAKAMAAIYILDQMISSGFIHPCQNGGKNE